MRRASNGMRLDAGGTQEKWTSCTEESSDGRFSLGLEHKIINTQVTRNNTNASASSSYRNQIETSTFTKTQGHNGPQLIDVKHHVQIPPHNDHRPSTHPHMEHRPRLKVLLSLLLLFWYVDTDARYDEVGDDGGVFIERRNNKSGFVRSNV
jgi:hypothetical protein